MRAAQVAPPQVAPPQHCAFIRVDLNMAALEQSSVDTSYSSEQSASIVRGGRQERCGESVVLLVLLTLKFSTPALAIRPEREREREREPERERENFQDLQPEYQA